MSEKVEDYELKEGITALAVDTHCHLDRFEYPEDYIIEREDYGLKYIVGMAGEQKIANMAFELAQWNQGFYYAIGLHPFDKHLMNDEYIEFVEGMAKIDPYKFVAIGEIGLDYSKTQDKEEIEAQKEVFIRQLILADKLSRPVCLHIRNAHNDAIEILEKNKKLLKKGGIIHCFSGTVEDAKKYLALGFHISFAGNITYKKKADGIDLVESLKAVPLDKLLIETDAPFLAPMPYRGQINEPKLVVVTAEFIAGALNMDVNELINITTNNAVKLFNINPKREKWYQVE